MCRDRHHSLRSSLLVCSPPRSPLPLRHRPQGSRVFSIRAEPASLPSQASDMLAVRTRQLTAEDFHLFRLAALSAAPGAGTTLASAPASPLCCAHGTTRVRRPSRAGRRPVPLLRGEGRRTLGLGWEAWPTGE